MACAYLSTCRLCFTLLFLFLFLDLAKEVGTSIINNPAADFKKYKIAQPILYDGGTWNEISTTRKTRGGHHSSVRLKITVDGEEIVLDLDLNENLVSGDHTLKYQEVGRTVIHKPKKEELDLCHYHGSVRGKSNSWAAVSTCHGVSGVIFDGTKIRYIEPAQGIEPHFIYEHNQLDTSNQKTMDGLFKNNKQQIKQVDQHDIYQDNQFKKAKYPQMPEPYNADDESRYIELVMVVDYDLFKAKGKNLSIVHSEMISMINILNTVYYIPLNIYVALVGVEVWTEGDQINMNYEDIPYLAQSFLKYREEKLSKEKPNDIALLITGKKFGDVDSKIVLGFAYEAVMCSSDLSGAIIKYRPNVLGSVVSTIAHEIGHTLGMKHDTGDYCKCKGKKCTMSAYNFGDRYPGWSKCSLQYLNEFFNNGQGSCLLNKPNALFQSPTCGNGFVEKGEQCDCGIVRNGQGTRKNPCHACCDPKTCMLRSNATCSAGTCCDISACRLKPAGITCRAAIADCDLPEYCSGDSSYCPDDVYQPGAMPPCGVKNQVTPISYVIPNGMYPGRELRIDASTSKNAQRFAINLQCGPSTNRTDDIALHIFISLERKIVLRNYFNFSAAKGTRKWGREEKFGDIPMNSGEPFKVMILCKKDCFQVTINGMSLTEFKHRIPYERITHLNFEEQVTVTSVTFKDSAALMKSFY